MASEPIVANSSKPKSSITDFVRDTRREIGKVTWPTRPEIGVTTAMIIVFALISGVFFLLVDTGLGFLVSHLLGMSGN